MINDEENRIKKLLENSIEINSPEEVTPQKEVDVAAEEEKSIDYTD